MNEKTCSRCKLTLPLEAFGPDKRAPTGLAYYCRACARAAVARSKLAHGPYASNDRERDALPHRREALARRGAVIRRAHPERSAAVRKVHRAVARGLLVKAPCAVCGESRVEGHHPDYTRPLDVIWLCPSHHRKLHAGALTLPA